MNNWGQLGVFDLETTGVDVDTARIVSACVAILNADGSVVARWDWLADPGIDIPAGASAVHGITTERAQALGRNAKAVVGEISQSLRVLFALGIPLVVYNAPYDLTLLDRECRRYGLEPLAEALPVIDPLVLDKVVDRYRKGKRTLEVTAALYKVELDDAHDAGADAIAAGRVALALGAAYPEQLDVPLLELHANQITWYAEQAAGFADYIRRVKGDQDFVADSEWPIRGTEHPTSILDTQPIPAPSPRPSYRVPHLDFDTGVLVLDRPALEASSARPTESVSPSEAIQQDDVAPEPVDPHQDDTDQDDTDQDDADQDDTDQDDAHQDDAHQDDTDQQPDEAIVASASQVTSESDDEQSYEPLVLVNSLPLEPDDPDKPDEPDEPEEDDPEALEALGEVEEVGEPDDATFPQPISAGDAADLPSTGLSPEGPAPDLAAVLPTSAQPASAQPASAQPASDDPAETVPERPTLRPTVLRVAAAIITDDEGRTLLVRKRGSSAFMQAGGKIERGESAVDALSRELREEVGLELDLGTTEYLGSFRAEAVNEPDTVIRAEVFSLSTTADLVASGEIEELLWIDSIEPEGVSLAPLTRDTILPLWATRRASGV